MGGATGREVKGEDRQGGGAGLGGGGGKGAIVPWSCGHLSGQVENGESTPSADWPCIADG